MSMNKNELKKLKNEIEEDKGDGVTNVRLRNDVYLSVKERVKGTKNSITKFVTLAVIEKLIREN